MEDNISSKSNLQAKVLIVDAGTYSVKFGFSGIETRPKIFRSLIGRPTKGNGCSYVGNEVVKKKIEMKTELKVVHPIRNLKNMEEEEYETVFDHLFNQELKIKSEENPILLPEVPLNRKVIRERMAQIMFEKFTVPSLMFANQSVLSLYASGKKSGVVLESGYGLSHIVPVFEGSSLTDATYRNLMTGKDIDEYFGRLLLVNRGISLTDSFEKRETVTNIKEKLCFVSVDYKKELENAEKSSNSEREYELPGGSKIKIRKSRFMATEIMFDPEIIGKGNEEGIQYTLFKSIRKCKRMQMGITNEDLQENIFLSGGSTMYKGYGKRIQNEIQKMYPKEKVLVNEPEDRNLSAWKGGAVVSSMLKFMELFTKKSEYKEIGPSIVNRKGIF